MQQNMHITPMAAVVGINIGNRGCTTFHIPCPTVSVISFTVSPRTSSAMSGMVSTPCFILSIKSLKNVSCWKKLMEILGGSILHQSDICRQVFAN